MKNESLTVIEVLEIGDPWYARVIVIQNKNDNTYQIEMSYPLTPGESYSGDKKISSNVF